MTDPASRSTYVRLSSFYFLYFLVLGTMLPYWSLFLDASGLTAIQIATIFAITSAVRIAAPYLWGWVCDHGGRPVFIIRLTSIGALLAFGLIPFMSHGVWIAAAVAVHTLFWNGILSQYEVVTLNSLRGHYQYYGRIRMWGSVSFIVAVWGGGFLFDVIDVLYFPWLMIATLAVVAAGSFSIRDPGGQPPRQTQLSIRPLLRRPQVLAFIVGCFLIQASHAPYYAFFSLYAEGLGYSRVGLGFLWAIGVFAEVAVFAFMHHLLRCFSVYRLLLISTWLTVLRWVLTALFADSVIVLLAAQSLHAFSYGSFHGAAIEYVRRVFGIAHQGRGQALYSAVSFGAGGTIGAIIGGWLWQSNAQLMFGACAAMAMCCGVIIALWVRDPHALGETSTVEERG